MSWNVHLGLCLFFSFNQLYNINYNSQFVLKVCGFVCCRFLSFFSDSFKTEESDDIHAGLALMYGYAAKYAPSTVIEARIDALVVCCFSLSL